MHRRRQRPATTRDGRKRETASDQRRCGTNRPNKLGVMARGEGQAEMQTLTGDQSLSYLSLSSCPGKTPPNIELLNAATKQNDITDLYVCLAPLKKIPECSATSALPPETFTPTFISPRVACTMVCNIDSTPLPPESQTETPRAPLYSSPQSAPLLRS